MNEDTDKNSILKVYEDGKHRRYELLFAVNGGAFAVAKLFPGHTLGYFLGNLTLDKVASGLILFTIVMGIDIFAFGYGMRKRAGYPNFLIRVWRKDTWHKDKWDGIFNWIGRFVLVLICLLIVLGWQQVASGPLLPYATCPQPPGAATSSAE